jgi:hypothetical protein
MQKARVQVELILIKEMLQNINYGERLYKKGLIQIEKTNKIINLVKEEKIKRQRSECTFSPKISKYDIKSVYFS